MRFTYAVIAALLLGFAAGRLGLRTGDTYELALYFLIFVIGLDIGKEGRLSELRKVGRLSLVLPFSTLVGSILGGTIVSVAFGIPILWGLAVASGVGWYSLTGPVLAQHSPFYGLLGFFANFLREVLTIVAYPLLVRVLPPEVALSIGGATTMDSTLPIIAKFGGRDVVLLAFIHGFILSLLVPFVVPLLAGLAAG
ncbi:lysine exporter LysO family protein [Pyrococcus yayanosii]|uniref:Lysine exporter LysO family protein n=1 Tax=Pyrococcus yayanosii (strain CH1 / JCM 16557) TaxID=529709 RepID=F8AF47_PYRYC|nr:lysine exporter LysO family protein [Pyrococcus yayanosii]AEH23721.1 hypothetical protein PYCH_00080 [Pyrococcus yayanosii CH1]